MKIYKLLGFLLVVSGYSLTANSKTTSSKSTDCHYQMITINGVERQVVKKPGATVCLKYQVPQKIIPGTNFTLQIQLSNNGQSKLQSKLKLPSKIQFSTKVQSQQKISTDINKGLSSQFQLKASEKGFYYIHLIVVSGIGDAKRMRAFAIPINVGEVNPRDYLKTNGQIKITDKGKKIVDMQAIQTRH